jgi:hypothetical protein
MSSSEAHNKDLFGGGRGMKMGLKIEMKMCIELKIIMCVEKKLGRNKILFSRVNSKERNTA